MLVVPECCIWRDKKHLLDLCFHPLTNTGLLSSLRWFLKLGSSFHWYPFRTLPLSLADHTGRKLLQKIGPSWSLLSLLYSQCVTHHNFWIVSCIVLKSGCGKDRKMDCFPEWKFPLGRLNTAVYGMFKFLWSLRSSGKGWLRNVWEARAEVSLFVGLIYKALGISQCCQSGDTNQQWQERLSWEGVYERRQTQGALTITRR